MNTKINTNLRVLVVDDFATMRRILRNLLKDLGYHNVEEAEDGAIALQKLKSNNYDLVISDWHMPPPNGLELVRIIRADPALLHIPILMVTAESERVHIIEVVQAGASGYIVKPFTAKTLQEKLEKIVPQIATLESSADLNVPAYG